MQWVKEVTFSTAGASHKAMFLGFLSAGSTEAPPCQVFAIFSRPAGTEEGDQVC